MPAPARLETSIHSLEVVLTAGCNLRCTYCYQNDKKDRHTDWEIVRVALDRLLSSTRPEVKVLFIGGEPLLEFPTIERAVAYLAERKRPDLRIRYSIVTNGLLLDGPQTEFLVEHGFHMQLSFDGVPPAQALRGMHTFSKLDRLLDSLRDRHPGFYAHDFKVNVTLVPSTIQYLADSVEYFVLDKQLNELSVTPQITPSQDWRIDRIEELERAFARIFRICLKRYRETGDVPLEVFRKQGTRRAVRPSHISMCGVGRGEQIAVDVDGQAHGCVTFVESYQTFPTTFLRSRVEAMRLGDIRDAQFGERLQAYPAVARSAEIFHHKEEKYSAYGKCRECTYLIQCSICPMSIGRNENENDPRRIPDFPCAYNLVSLKYRARFPRMRTWHEILVGPRRMRPRFPGVAVARWP